MVNRTRWWLEEFNPIDVLVGQTDRSMVNRGISRWKEKKAVLARSASFRTNSCGFNYYNQFIPLDLDPIDF
jgi:hypothetical protein